MIRIQQLKQPKSTSGKKLEKGDSFTHAGVEVKNHGKAPIYVDTFIRKKTKPKGATKK